MTAAEIKENILNGDQIWMERAIVAIYKRQTAAEQSGGETSEHNGMGFNKFHARMGTYWAKHIMGGGHLYGDHVEKARKMIARYSGQLATIVAEKELVG